MGEGGHFGGIQVGWRIEQTRQAGGNGVERRGRRDSVIHHVPVQGHG